MAQRKNKKIGCFPENIYKRNLFYDFSHFNFNEMKKVINRVPYKSMSTNELQQIQSIFEDIKNNTLVEIYSLAGEKPNLFERMSRIQLAEHQKCLRLLSDKERIT